MQNKESFSYLKAYSTINPDIDFDKWIVTWDSPPHPCVLPKNTPPCVKHPNNYFFL